MPKTKNSEYQLVSTITKFENSDYCLVVLWYTENGETSRVDVLCDDLGKACCVQSEALENAKQDGMSIDWY